MNYDQFDNLMGCMSCRVIHFCQNGQRQELLNERFFHHMFSCFVASYLWDNGQYWTTLSLVPEAPTQQQFNWGNVDLGNPVFTRDNAIGNGTRGNLDFKVQQEEGPTFCIEWKGPKIFSAGEMAQVLLKLVTQPQDELKVICAFITSTATNRADHLPTLVGNFNCALNFVQQTLQNELPDQIEDWNLYAFIASFPDNGVHYLNWGPLTRQIEQP